MIWFKNFLTTEEFHKLVRDIEECAREINRLNWAAKELGENNVAKKAGVKEKLRTIFNQLIEKL